MRTHDADALRSEIVSVRDSECIETISRIRDLLASETTQPETLRLMTIPILYSVWERAFSNWTAICLRVVQDNYFRAIDCPAKTRAYWLRKADFFKSFVDSIRDVLELEREDSTFQQSTGFRKKITKGGFSLSSQVLLQLDDWHEKPLAAKDLSSLVITYSNVNDSVVTTNAEAIGLSELHSFSMLDLSRLGELVGMRNGIGHGASLTPPGKRNLDELINYTENLIRQYADVSIEWITRHEEVEAIAAQDAPNDAASVAQSLEIQKIEVPMANADEANG